ncbi:MAG: hypothetical protein K9J12_08350 [Melioribacteraceae bacterium]|nr:hypothetical protein [Melioribacteraceae bacterium]MCF8266148.1 hypothetical protein [Melioribacteraceae bacterium]MCF8431658.1 hypothetical protein [Melioribacteraceae bacterium]
MKQVKKSSSLLLVVYSIVILAGFNSCSTDNVDSKKNLARLYSDLIIAEETRYKGIDSLTIIRNQLFEKYKIDEEFLDSKIKEYSNNSDEWQNFYQYSLNYLDSLQSAKTL